MSTLRKWGAGDVVIVCTASGFEGGESQALGVIAVLVGLPALKVIGF